MVSENEVAAFKKRYCDENAIIGTILKSELGDWVEGPILDVGCGLGDLSLFAFQGKVVWLLDRLDFSHEPTSTWHTRVQMDFWDYQPNEMGEPRTLLFSHVLQFLDDSPAFFRGHVRRLNASRIVTVTNFESGALGTIVDWAGEHLQTINPERDEPTLFVDYRKVGEWPFEASLDCPDFETLTEQVMYLLDVRLELQDRELLQAFLEAQLLRPSFTIQQRVVAYLRNDQP